MLISGLTVMVAMAGLFLTGDATFASFGYATMIVVAVAMLGSLTVLPALLSRLGDSVDRLRVPLVGRLRRDDGEGRIWGAIVDRVLRRPLLSALVAGGLLLALAAPALQLRIATPRPEAQFPKSLDIVKTYERMQQAFPGTALPANVVLQAPNVNAPAVQVAIGRLERAGARERADGRGDHRRGQRGRDRREHHGPDRGHGHRPGVEHRPGRAPRRDRARRPSARSRAPRPASPG